MNENRIVGRIYKEREYVSSRDPYDEYESYIEILYDLAIRNKKVIKLIKKLEILNKLEDTYPYLTDFSIYSFSDEFTDDIKKKYIEISVLEPEIFEIKLIELINVKKDMQFRENWVEELQDSSEFNEKEFIHPVAGNELDINKYKYKSEDISFENSVSLNEGNVRFLRNELRHVLEEEFLIYSNDELIDSKGNELFCFSLSFNSNEIVEDLIEKKFRKYGTSFKKGNFLDYFFVYDYYQIKLKQYLKRKEVINQFIEEKKEEISFIENSSDYTRNEKDSLKKDIKNEIEKELDGFISEPRLNKTHKDYVFNQKEFIKSGINSNTASKYYQNISNLIKELEYKKILLQLEEQLY